VSGWTEVFLGVIALASLAIAVVHVAVLVAAGLIARRIGRLIDHVEQELRPIFDPRAAVLAEVDGRPVACAVAVPDINQALKGTGGRLFPLGVPRLLLRHRLVDQARLLLLGVVAEYRRPGLYPLLLHELHRQLAGSQYRRVEFSWVLEDNRDINQPAELAGAARYKTYRIYEKAVQ